MTASEPLPFQSWSPSPVDNAEAALQQELRAMFEVDTQQYLQDYFSLVQQLKPQSWSADIQHIYRAVHTIKGGAVTVEADAMLHTGMVLEDLLSDLRYLEQSPDLSDGQLSQMLLEAGELLSSSLEIKGTGIVAISQVRPTVDRIHTLHEQIRQRYLPDWNELKQVHQEFAEQGFDLVVLGLEMALNQLLPLSSIPTEIVQTAQQTLDQLTQIGRDLQFAPGWTTVVAQCQALTGCAEVAQWQRCWPIYFQILKDCAKQGGELSPILQTRLESLTATSAKVHGSTPRVEEPTNGPPAPADLLELLDVLSLDGLDLGDLDSGDLDAAEIAQDPLESEALSLEVVADLTLLTDLDLALPHAEPLEAAPPLESIDLLERSLDELQDWDAAAIASFSNDFSTDVTDLGDLPDLDTLAATEPVDANPEAAAGLFPEAITQAAAALEIEATLPDLTAEAKRSIQISVPLERLDQSAQQVLETLLTARGVINISQKLQTQLAQITSLTQESAHLITRLRQIQDDYALLRTLSDDQDDSNNVTLERYRQGYTTINRLLENILRMSELGQEIETVTQQTSGRLDKLDRSILRLKDGIETSRLVPFRNLTLRARAIVRDLSNRYGKPVELQVEGEQMELDAGILQQLEPALLHLLRNAYDHGLESVEQRLAQGKSARGTLVLSLSRRGNLYRLVLQDDGGGIDRVAITQIAQEKGFALTQTRTTTELLAVLCQPGFSSRSAVTEVSGRGVGMDVVASQIATINGKFSLETLLGKGTTFTIEVPAPQLLVPCVLMVVGDRTIALPTDEIVETVLLDPDQFAHLEGVNPLLTWMLQTREGSVPAFDLANYWRQAEQLASPSTARVLTDTVIAIKTRVVGANLWFIADDLLGQEELLINPLPSPLVAPAGLLGVSLQPDGRLILILDPISLTAAIQSAPGVQASRPTPTQAVPAQSGAIKILLVDDAALMRRRLEGSLSTHGFTTFTCADGIEAWNWLQANELPDLMITDVEMPNMDGFTLIDRCRQAGLDLPILVVSSRLSEEWSKEARRLGASDYLNKGFSTSELLNKVNQLLSFETSVFS